MDFFSFTLKPGTHTYKKNGNAKTHTQRDTQCGDRMESDIFLRLRVTHIILFIEEKKNERNLLSPIWFNTLAKVLSNITTTITITDGYLTGSTVQMTVRSRYDISFKQWHSVQWKRVVKKVHSLESGKGRMACHKRDKKFIGETLKSQLIIVTMPNVGNHV